MQTLSPAWGHVCNSPAQKTATQSFPYLPVFTFLLPPPLLWSLSLGGLCSVLVQHSTTTDSQHLEWSRTSSFTTVHCKEKLLRLSLGVALTTGNKLKSRRQLDPITVQLKTSSKVTSKTSTFMDFDQLYTTTLWHFILHKKIEKIV